MTFLFWLCWAFDLLAAAVLVWAVGFRSGFGASTGLQQGLLLLVAVILIAGPLLRFNGRIQGISLVVVALPIFLLIISWFISKINASL